LLWQFTLVYNNQFFPPWIPQTICNSFHQLSHKPTKPWSDFARRHKFWYIFNNILQPFSLEMTVVSVRCVNNFIWTWLQTIKQYLYPMICNDLWLCCAMNWLYPLSIILYMSNILFFLDLVLVFHNQFMKYETCSRIHMVCMCNKSTGRINLISYCPDSCISFDFSQFINWFIFFELHIFVFNSFWYFIYLYINIANNMWTGCICLISC